MFEVRKMYRHRPIPPLPESALKGLNPIQRFFKKSKHNMAENAKRDMAVPMSEDSSLYFLPGNSFGSGSDWDDFNLWDK